MQQTASRNFAPADTNRLRELLNPAGSNRLSVLLKLYACADVAQVDDVAFSQESRRVDLPKKGRDWYTNSRKISPAGLTVPWSGSAQTRDTYAKDMLTVVAREFLQAAHEAENPEVEKGKPPGDEPSG
jgi:hypothetical protein